MNYNNTHSFQRGLIAGGALGGLIMWLAVSERTRKLREQAAEYAADAYDGMKNAITESEAWNKVARRSSSRRE